ncbi:MAG: ABC transporter permease subunit [Clostridiales bacterium]|nr:ABC transporter permease subunit [Clostridiales bacterium]
MNKLLYANFKRLWKNRLFWTGMIFMFLAGSALVLKQYEQHINYGHKVKLESTFFAYAMMIGVVSAIFCTLFAGVEYSDGTMRNKIIAGHKRTDIYFSSLIVNGAASLLLCCSYILSNIIWGLPLIGFKKAGLETILILLAGSMITVIALCSIFTMVSLLVHGKALAPVICIVGIFLLIAFTNEVQRVLDQPKVWYDGTPNMAYVEGAERERLEFIYNALPAGQEMQYARMETKNIGKMCAYSTGMIVLTSGIGSFIFKRKDIK